MDQGFFLGHLGVEDFIQSENEETWHSTLTLVLPEEPSTFPPKSKRCGGRNGTSPKSLTNSLMEESLNSERKTQRSIQPRLTSVDKYLSSMVCKKCHGDGCEYCKYTGSSKRFQKLLDESTQGLK